MSYDLLFENGPVVTPEGVSTDVAVGIDDGSIVAVGAPGSLDTAERVVDLGGRYLLPGIVDCHIHARAPGDEYKEDWATATQAAAAGGVTTVLAMPNTDPIVDTPAVLDEVFAIAQGDAHVDFGLYAVLTSENYDTAGELAAAGAAGFKVFLGSTFGGITAPNDGELYEAMGDVAAAGKRVGFHEENDEILSHLEQQFKTQGRNRPIDHSLSRPVIAEAEAVSRIILLAEHADCPVHMFHLSSGTGAEIVARGKDRGVNVSAETTPQYLWFTEEVMREKGNVARMQPPIRGAYEQALLWDTGVHGSGIDCIATDHAPHTSEDKNVGPDGDPFADTWESISGFVGLQSEVPAMHTFVEQGRLSLPRWVYMHSTRPAQLWGLYPQKGSLTTGTDADLTIVDPTVEFEQTAADLYSKSTVTPFNGERFTGAVSMTVVRGVVVYEDGAVQSRSGFGERVESGPTVDVNGKYAAFDERS